MVQSFYQPVSLRMIRSGVCSCDAENLSRAAHRLEENCLPLSDVIVDGTPNLAIQPFTSAYAQDSAIISTNSIASGH